MKFYTDILTPNNEVFIRAIGSTPAASLRWAEANLKWMKVEDKYQDYIIGNTYKAID